MDCFGIKHEVQCSLASVQNDSSNEAILGAFSNVRLIASLAKVDATVALAKDVLNKESSLVIFTFFVDVAKKVRQKLKESGWHGELLSGETAAKDRQSMVDRFQVCWGISFHRFAINPLTVIASMFTTIKIGWSISCVCNDIWSWRCWNNFDSSKYYYLIGSVS